MEENGSTIGVVKDPTQAEFKQAHEGSTGIDKKFVKLGELNE